MVFTASLVIYSTHIKPIGFIIAAYDGLKYCVMHPSKISEECEQGRVYQGWTLSPIFFLMVLVNLIKISFLGNMAD